MSARRATLLLVALVGCARTQGLARHIASLESDVASARDSGAYRCAPEELALSDAHLEFAAAELRQGNVERARQHLVLARANAGAALRLSASCSGERGHESSAYPSASRWLGPSENASQRALRRRSIREYAAI